jgi:hypothetical protein
VRGIFSRPFGPGSLGGRLRFRCFLDKTQERSAVTSTRWIDRVKIVLISYMSEGSGRGIRGLAGALMLQRRGGRRSYQSGVESKGRVLKSDAKRQGPTLERPLRPARGAANRDGGDCAAERRIAS